MATVAPGSWTFAAQMGVFLVLFGVLTAVGLDDDAVFYGSFLPSFLALYAAETRWRRTHAPSEDPPRRLLWRRRAPTT